MPAVLRRLLQLLSLIGLLLGSAWAGAAQRALLVGVSELANQPAALWLQTPRNDVLLMRDALARHGFAPADITVLADGVPGATLPEAQAIHDALQRLLAQSRSGDVVVLYFSGHGTRLRDTAKRYQEPDGLAENFLARDVRGAIGGTGPLGGGMVCALLVGLGFHAWGGLDRGLALASPLLAVLAQIGDLYESSLKRTAGVKDSGTMLPGHGGVMDRLDGVITVAPAVALLLVAGAAA